MLHLGSRAPFQELIAHYSTDNKTGEKPKGEGAGSYDFPIEFNGKLIISYFHFAGCVSFQRSVHYAPKPLSRKSEMRCLLQWKTRENRGRNLSSTPIKIYLISAKEYTFFPPFYRLPSPLDLKQLEVILL